MRTTIAIALVLLLATPAFAGTPVAVRPMSAQEYSDAGGNTTHWDPTYPSADDGGQDQYPGEDQGNGDIWITGPGGTDVWNDECGPGWSNTYGLVDGPEYPAYGARWIKLNADGSITEYMQTNPQYEYSGVKPKVVGKTHAATA